MNPEADFLPPAVEPPLSKDFQENVIHRIAKRHARQQTVYRITCVTLFLLSASIIYHKRWRPEPMVPQNGQVESANKGIEWLLANQNSQGTWSAEQWGGHPQFNQGIDALGTLALLNAPSPVNRESFDAAVQALENALKAQSTYSMQGPEFYNHILTLYTLSEIEKQMPSTPRRELLASAYARLIRQQQSSGGWGYLNENVYQYSQNEDANSAVTWWVCHLLANHPFQRLPQADIALAQGKQWLQKRELVSGEVAYHSDARSTAGPADALYWMISSTKSADTFSPLKQDAYRDFFRTMVQNDPAFFKTLWEQQQESGAWENREDRWWQAGGKVYLTALSVLSQVPGGV